MVAFYMDVPVKDAITRGLRRRGVDVLTAQEDGAGRVADSDLLNRAAELNRLIFTQDDDFLVEASRRQTSGEHFVGVLYQHQQATVIGQCIDDLKTIALVSELEEYANQVRYLPL